MSVVIDYGLSFDEARARDLDVYNAWVDIWGSRFGPPDPLVLGTDAYPDLTTPPLPASIAGIAIGPESDVDRVWLSTNLAKKTPSNVTSVFAIREISVEAPLLYTQGARIGPPIGNPNSPVGAQEDGNLYVFAENLIGIKADTTVIPEFYLDINGAQQTLNSFPDAINFDLVYPRLQLQLLLKEGVLPATKRVPVRWGNSDNSILGGINPVETRVKILPIYGRKRIAVQMRGRSQPAGAAGINFTFRVAAIRPLGYVSLVQEETVGLKTATTSVDGCSTSFNFCDLNADFLILYVAADPGGVLTGWSVSASD